MADVLNQQEVLLENLQDAGCCSQMIEQCMTLYNNSQSEKMIRELRKYRTCILDQIHQEQNKLESLDYLIYKLEK